MAEGSYDLETTKQAILTLLNVSDPAEALVVIQTHPALLTDEADWLFQALIEDAREQNRPTFLAVLTNLHHLLKTLRAQQPSD